MPEIAESVNLASINEVSVIVRLILAALLGGILGFERTRKMRAAGLRTYMLVCIGAATVMMTGQYVYAQLGVGDPTRMASQVISGIGFLGAGTIMVTGYHRVRGLTTAAGLWLSACLGLAIGIGFYFGAVAMLTVAMTSIVIGEHFQVHYLKNSNRIRIYILFESGNCVKEFMMNMKKRGIVVSDFNYIGTLGDSVSASFSLKLGNKYKHADIIEELSVNPTILFFEEM